MVTKPKATHKKGAAKVKKQSSSTKPAPSKDAKAKQPHSDNRKTTKCGSDDDNDQLKKKRKESDQHDIDDYLKQGSF